MSILGSFHSSFLPFFARVALVLPGPCKEPTALLANVQLVLSAVVTWHCKKTRNNDVSSEDSRRTKHGEFGRRIGWVGKKEKEL